MNVEPTTTTATRLAPLPLRRTNTCPPDLVCTIDVILGSDVSSKVETKKHRRETWCGETVIPFVLKDTRGCRRHRSSYIRKAKCALTGGTMVGVGLVMMPLPIPMGIVVAGAGMGVLGKEFPAAKRMLETTKGKITQTYQKLAEYDDDDDDDDDSTCSSWIEDTVVFGFDDDDSMLSPCSTCCRPQHQDYGMHNDDSSEEVIFDMSMWKKDESEVFDSTRIPERDMFVSVWSA